jgi:UDP-GlcNAc:undecaprenyl-phosphate GlcNAc-1-phosphate transferase
MGGIAIVTGFMITMAALSIFIPELRTKQFAGFMAGACVITFVGALDDMFTLKPVSKLIYQIIAAVIVIASGTKINFVMWPFAANFNALSAPVTLIWIIGVTNAVNLIDGIDGLAAGVTSISAICLTILCVISGSPIAVALTATLAGSCCGFLPRNFSPAEVIMGDTGALFLGYVLAVSSIIGVFKGYALLSLVTACFTLALPIFDTLFALARRAAKGKPIMGADRGHLHHRLIDAGLSPGHAVVTLYGLSAVCGVIAIVIALKNFMALLVAVISIFVFIIMLFAYRRRVNSQKTENKATDRQ